MALDYVFRIDQPHIRGQLAQICNAIADADALIGDIVTITMGRDRSVREISVEVHDRSQAPSVAEHIEALEGVHVISFYDRALNAHEGGKLEIGAIEPLETLQHMRDVYTPGVARVCAAISDDAALASRFTMIGRTRRDLHERHPRARPRRHRPVASMPVMEGKALFYDQMAGISAMPILIDTTDIDEFVETVIRIAPGFGGIHLEDIRVPDCFEIERRLKEELTEPVMHDDVHGTGVATLAAALAACEQVGLDLASATVGQIGLGAAGFGIAAMMVDGGAKQVLASDPNEASHERARAAGIEIADYARIMAECDLVIATTGVTGLIKPKDIRPGSVIFALTNPHPEIEPRRGGRRRRRLRRRRHLRQQRARLPRHLPRRPRRRRDGDLEGDEARRRLRDRRPDGRVRAGSRRARPGRPPRRRRRRRGGRGGRGPRPARADPERAVARPAES